MKTPILFLILFLALSIELSAQDLLITGKVLTEENVRLAGATVEVNQTTGTVVDEEGKFEVKVENQDQKISLRVRMIGYETLDTIIQTELTKIHLELRLKETYYDQPELIVSDKKIKNIFDKDDWVILDSKIYKGFLFLIYIEANKRYIGLAKLNGVFVNQLKLDKKYDRIKESCMETLYLIGKNDYAVLKTNTDLTFDLENGKSIDDIKKYIDPCLFKLANQYVFKSYAKHNKEVNYFTYNEDKKQELILQLKDEKARRVAQSYYNDIIRLYYQGISGSKEEAIDEGVGGGVNIIERGEWSGDLEDLIGTLDPEIIFAISYYRNIEAQPIKILELKWQNRGYLIDLLNIEAYEILNNIKGTKKLKINNGDLIKKKQRYTVIQDKDRSVNYLIDKSHQLYSLSVKEEEIKIESFFKIDKADAFVRNVIINDDFLYYVYQPNRLSPYTKIKIEALK